MSRRAKLPGAAELFRPTSGTGSTTGSTTDAGPPAASVTSRGADSRPTPPIDRRPTGRVRHEEKITVYCSADELLALEAARLALRAEHGLAIDRGRIVREAVAVVLADLEAKGMESILVRRLHADASGDAAGHAAQDAAEDGHR